MARPEFGPRHFVFVYALAIVIAFVAFIVMAVMSVISVVFAMVPVVMSLVSMVSVVVSVVLRHVVAVVFMPTILCDLMAVVIAAAIFMHYVMAVVFVTILGSAVVLTVLFAAFFSGMFFTAIFTPLFSGMFFMPFFSGMLFAAFLVPFMRAIRHVVSMVFVPVVMMLRVVTDCIRMVIFVAVHPSALPRRIIDEHHATVPGNAVITPSPWTISNSHHHAKSEANRGADKESRTRPLIDYNGVIGGDHNVVHARWHDRNKRSAAHNDLWARAQISVITRALPHSLHCIHYFLLLAQKCIAQIGRPVHV